MYTRRLIFDASIEYIVYDEPDDTFRYPCLRNYYTGRSAVYKPYRDKESSETLCFFQNESYHTCGRSARIIGQHFSVVHGVSIKVPGRRRQGCFYRPTTCEFVHIQYVKSLA